jgi:hypothetical protein
VRATSARTSRTPPTRDRVRRPARHAGDTYDRYLIRIEEFRQSIRIIRQALDGLPEGPIIGKVPRLIKPPAGETYHAIESPKGELGYFIASDGKSTVAVPLPRAAAVVLQPAGAAAPGQGAPGLRRRRAHRLDRHRARRGGPVIETRPASPPAVFRRRPPFVPRSSRSSSCSTGARAVPTWCCSSGRCMAWVQVRLGPMRVGPARRAAADRRRGQADPQGGHHAGPRRQVGLHAGADHLDGAGADRLRGDPVRPEVTIFGYTTVPLYIADINVGLLYIVSVTSIGVYGIILAGWASNSKYPLLAGLRASAQLISYEIAVTMTLVSMVVTAGTLSMVGIVEAQAPRGVVRVHPAGGASSSSSSAASPRPTARRSTCRRPSRSWSAASTPSTAACASRCSSSPSTPT